MVGRAGEGLILEKECNLVLGDWKKFLGDCRGNFRPKKAQGRERVWCFRKKQAIPPGRL